MVLVDKNIPLIMRGHTKSSLHLRTTLQELQRPFSATVKRRIVLEIHLGSTPSKPTKSTGKDKLILKAFYWIRIN